MATYHKPHGASLIQAYRFHRARSIGPAYPTFPRRAAGNPAWHALQAARADVEAGKDRYPPSACGSFGAESNGLRWVENPTSNGLRFVGWCDEIACRNYRYAGGIGHRGWFTEDDGLSGETMRGAVYQLPARDGHPVYVSGYVMSHENAETDARLNFRNVTLGDNGEDDDATREAAYFADRLAERAAEDERDHNRAWRAGLDAKEAENAAIEVRGELLAFLRELKPKKAAFCDSPAPIQAARDKVNSLLESMASFRAERDRLRDDHERHNPEAFADGYASA